MKYRGKNYKFIVGKWSLAIVTTLAWIILSVSPSFAQTGLIGWATVHDLGVKGTSGGSNGSIVRVKSKEALQRYAGAKEPYVILIEGYFSGSGFIEMESNKSIIGIGSGAIFDGFGIDVKYKQNIIIRNIQIENAKPDGIAMRQSHHVWIDHCDLSSCDDGLLDFTIGSNYITVSWSIFHDHDKVSLANGGSRDFKDIGNNKITFHHNWFKNTVQRNPRIGYGQGHLFNNLYTQISSYCIGYHTGASLLIENNYFSQSKNPLKQMYTSDSTSAHYANAKEVGNIFDNTIGNTGGTGLSFDPELFYTYKFILDSTKNVPSKVKSIAGLRPNIEDDIIPLSSNGDINASNICELAWSEIEKVNRWEVYFGKDAESLVRLKGSRRSVIKGNLCSNSNYFWKVRAIKVDTIIESSLFSFRTAPIKAHNPYPKNNEEHAKLREIKSEYHCGPIALRWNPSFETEKYKVYIGSSIKLTEADLKGETKEARFDASSLKSGVRYYWKVVSVSKSGLITEGDLWSFKSDVCYSQAGITEAENMVINGNAFVEKQDGSWFPASNNKVVSGEAGPGTLSSIWAGPNAECSISISYFDESDGDGWYGFFINDRQVDGWLASSRRDSTKRRYISYVQLHEGDELRIEFYTNKGELNRTDSMDIKILSKL